MATLRSQIGLVSQDRELLARLKQLFPTPPNEVFMVGAADAVDYFVVGQNNLVLIDCQLALEGHTAPVTFFELIGGLAARGLRVAVVIPKDYYSTVLAICLMESGACSFTFSGVADSDLEQWIQRLFALPLRGAWAEKIVFP